ncbi:unnamed protein product [Urochloa decumbens]|uniref:DUF1618 domain-containing protein n=1 Tax=Urochloa decumbens TaxID=240449 RepID=A0ABC8WJF6_9POAL
MAAVGEVASSWVPPPLPECDGDAPSGSVLLDMRCYIADLPNATTATGVTGGGLPIQVTFRAARPPALSHLCVHCPGADFSASAPSRVVASHADLLLLRVPTHPDSLSCVKAEFWDYFVYRAHPPRLDLIPNPHPKRVNDCDAALISLDNGGGGYVVAALRNRIPRPDPSGGRGAYITTEFDLHLYRSSNPDEGWVTTTRLSVEDPVRDALVPLPRVVADLLPYHETGKAIAVGGERGTVAWVDLWRGIILCDVLDESPALRDVPLPVPARGNWDRLVQECDPSYVRDVTISRHENSIKYVEMELNPPKHLEKTTTHDESYLDWARHNRRNSLVRGHGWKITTWTMPIVPAASWEDWRREHDVHVNDLAVDASKPWPFKTLSNHPQGSSDTKAVLRRLSVAYPTISMDDEDVVYLLSNVDELDVVVAVDVKKKALRGVAELDTQKNFYLMPSYCSSEISSYLKKTSE